VQISLCSFHIKETVLKTILLGIFILCLALIADEAMSGEEVRVVPTRCNILNIETQIYTPCIAGESVSIRSALVQITEAGITPSPSMFIAAYEHEAHLLKGRDEEGVWLRYSPEDGFMVTTGSRQFVPNSYGAYLMYAGIICALISGSTKTRKWWVRPFSTVLILALIICFIFEQRYALGLVNWLQVLLVSGLCIGAEAVSYSYSAADSKAESNRGIPQ